MASHPSAVHGGQAARVTRTGLALVHEGELVLPAAGSEVQAARVGVSDRTAIHYHFPVEIEVVAGGQAESLDRLADHILHKLGHAIDSLNTG